MYIYIYYLVVYFGLILIYTQKEDGMKRGRGWGRVWIRPEQIDKIFAN